MGPLVARLRCIQLLPSHQVVCFTARSLVMRHSDVPLITRTAQ